MRNLGKGLAEEIVYLNLFFKGIEQKKKQEKEGKEMRGERMSRERGKELHLQLHNAATAASDTTGKIPAGDKVGGNIRNIRIKSTGS